MRAATTSAAPGAPRPDGETAPKRSVFHGDALEWLQANAPLDGASVVTSLPDASELPAFDLPGWQRWFEDAAAHTMSAVTDAGVAIFFQSDVRHEGRWIDKGAMVSRAAERTGMSPLFHKIVCRKPPGTVTIGRASYSHLLGFARTLRPSLRRITADVLPTSGFMPGAKAMGVAACLDACRFVRDETATRTIVDPFCGFGTVLAVANALGLDAFGVDLSARMCRRARALRLDLDRDLDLGRAGARAHFASGAGELSSTDPIAGGVEPSQGSTSDDGDHHAGS